MEKGFSRRARVERSFFIDIFAFTCTQVACFNLKKKNCFPYLSTFALRLAH